MLLRVVKNKYQNIPYFCIIFPLFKTASPPIRVLTSLSLFTIQLLHIVSIHSEHSACHSAETLTHLSHFLSFS